MTRQRPYTIATTHPTTGQPIELEFIAPSRSQATLDFHRQYPAWKVKRISSLRRTIATIVVGVSAALFLGAIGLGYLEAQQSSKPTNTTDRPS